VSGLIRQPGQSDRISGVSPGNGHAALIPPFAEPFISGQDGDLELAPVIKRRGPAEGVVPARLALIRVIAG
jgi:hypothetical protein